MIYLNKCRLAEDSWIDNNINPDLNEKFGAFNVNPSLS